MNKLPNPEDLLKNYGLDNSDVPTWENYNEIVDIMKEYSRQIRDSTLDWAAENAELLYGEDEGQSTDIDKDSILKGKQSKDLKI